MAFDNGQCNPLSSRVNWQSGVSETAMTSWPTSLMHIPFSVKSPCASRRTTNGNGGLPSCDWLDDSDDFIWVFSIKMCIYCSTTVISEGKWLWLPVSVSVTIVLFVWTRCSVVEHQCLLEFRSPPVAWQTLVCANRRTQRKDLSMFSSSRLNLAIVRQCLHIAFPSQWHFLSLRYIPNTLQRNVGLPDILIPHCTRLLIN